jgi:16S rRNA (uracil1498-N3)-methyltransferase
MRHRIYVPEPLIAGAEVAIEGEELHHAARVVRVRDGEEVELFDGRGRCVAGKVIETGRQLRVSVEREVPSRELPMRITLAMAIIQLDKFELVLQKATELGAGAIVPLVTERVEIRPERYRGKAERWEKIVFEAVKQSGRSVIPSVEEPQPLETVLGRGGTKLFFDADEAPSAGGEASDATLFIGPEGGWSPDEIAMARQRGCHFRQLGPRRLRAETAAIVALGTITAHL